MNHQYFARIIVLIVCAGWLGACARMQESDTQQSAYFQRLAAELQKSTQPRERALAAQLLGMSALNQDNADLAASGRQVVDPAAKASIGALIAQASKHDDAVALSLAIQASNQVDDQAARLNAAKRWQAVESDNLVPRLLTDTPVESVLASARDTTRYETHGYEQVRLMTSVFKHWPMSREEMDSGYSGALKDDEARAAVSAFAIWAAYGIPGLQKLTSACRDEALLSTPTRRDDCLHVAKVLADNSSDVVSRSIGISMLERAASTPEDTALATRLRRNYEWQRHQYFVVLTQQMDEQQQVSEMLRLLKTPGVDNEIQLMEAALREKGVALVPPDDWQPPKRS